MMPVAEIRAALAAEEAGTMPDAWPCACGAELEWIDGWCCPVALLSDEQHAPVSADLLRALLAIPMPGGES